MSIAVIILAAGRGTRMKSAQPKVLHEVGGMPLVVHALRAARSLNPARRVVVAGVGAAALSARVAVEDPSIQVVIQDEQLGTGHAVTRAHAALADHDGDVVVLYGDTPFVGADTLRAMQKARSTGADLVCLGFHAADPGGYGRLVTQDGALLRIVEAKDASPEERAIDLCNSGVICAPRAVLFDLLGQVGNANAAGEYYLTDVIGLGVGQGLSARVVTCPEEETMGVNTRAELARAESILQSRLRARAMAGGATLTAPETVFLSPDTEIGRDVTIEPHVVIGAGVHIADGAVIRAFSHLEGCRVGADAVVGPYARLRPGTVLAEDVRVGNFVEIKNADLGPGAKANHLSYVGDATVGAGANIGAGTITCNYDGVFKHRTDIGAGAFIGSNSALVAPVRIGAGAMTAAGSTVTADVPDGALAVGRADQTNRPGLAQKIMARLRARKAGRAQ